MVRLSPDGTGKRRQHIRRRSRNGSLVLALEMMEPRTLLSVQPVVVGSVYIEEDLGSDQQGDRFLLTFGGGAAGTQLTQVIIDGDQNQAGFGVGDVFFDTETNPLVSGIGRYGADDSFNVQVISQDGIDRVDVDSKDGSTRIEFRFEGFDAGDRLVFTVDVDEVEIFDPTETDVQRINDGFDPIASGVEFQSSSLTANFVAPHFEPVQVQSEFVNRYDDLLNGTGLDLPADDAQGRRDRTAGAMAEQRQIVIPASLGGHVYHDRNQDGQRDAGEEGISDVEIRAIPVDTILEQDPVSVRTDAQGRYRFTGLMPGRYRVVEVEQPDGFFDWLDSAGAVDGVPSGRSINPGDEIDAIELGGGSFGDDYDFGEVRPVSITGQVHLADENSDCFSENVEHQPVDGALVQLLNASGVVVAETLSGADGSYSFEGLLPGTYHVHELTPTGLFDGGARAGHVDGNLRGTVVDAGHVSEIVLISGESVKELDFCEIEPVSVRGRVFLSDDAGNCFGSVENPETLANVRIQLRDEQGQVLAETLTDVQGRYEFFGLEPGVYSLVEMTPDGLIDGGARAGRIDGQVDPIAQVLGPGLITQIELGPGQSAVDFDFCEHAPSALSGYVYHDRDGDGRLQTGEEGIGDVELQLLDQRGEMVATQRTNSHGFYEFDGLLFGDYAIAEVHPPGWLDGTDVAGLINGRVVGRAINPGDLIDTIRLGSGQVGQRYNFGEQRATAILGNVHLSTVGGDCFGLDAEHHPLASVVVQLLDVEGQRIQETRTDSAGNYAFLDLVPGTYGVREMTPPDVINGGARSGITDGSQNGHVLDADTVVGIEMLSSQRTTHVDFCEHLPSQLGGRVYHDRNNDGRQIDGEEGIEGVSLQLLRENGTQVAVTTTDQDGNYLFDSLRAGIYRVIEVQPTGWLDGIDTVGTVDGILSGRVVNPGDAIAEIRLGWGQTGRDYNFGELVPARLAGLVHADLNADCLFQDDEDPIQGVRVDLLDAAGEVVATRKTDSQGRFLFAGLLPDNYTLREYTPDGFFHGGQVAGSGGGDASRDDLIAGITVQSGDRLVDYRFCEEPPSEISGIVFQDGPAIELNFSEAIPENLSELKDGRLTDDDQRLGGVELELRSGLTGLPVMGRDALPGRYPDGPIRTVTDADGFYRFAGLPKGNYAVYEVQPEGYLDGIDTSGSIPAIAINRHDYDDISPKILSDLRVDPRFDAIIRIALPPGRDSIQNNFSEIAIRRSIVPPFPNPVLAEAEPLAEITWNPPPPVERNVDPLPWELISFGGIQGAGANTWHLSVIDGGRPRGWGVTVTDRGPYWMLNDGEYEVRWDSPSMDQLVWHVFVDGETSKLTFGIENGYPITGDFNGDGFLEIGVFHEGQWFIDYNGNGTWDAGDLWAKLGFRDDQPVVGDWDGDGKDDIGVFGPAWPGDPRALRREPGLPDLQNTGQGEPKNIPPRPAEASQGRRELRVSRDGRTRSDVVDHVFHYGTHGDRAIAGDWNGDGITNIGVFYKGLWHLDVNGDGKFTDVDDEFELGAAGDVPIVGDFNGDGIDEVGLLSNGRIVLDINGNRKVDERDRVLSVPSQNVTPVVADWNGDGIDELGFTKRDIEFVEIDSRR